MKFGETIYQIRTQAKLSQAQFSELFNVSQQAVQKWECGTSIPDVEKIVKIAKYFDLSLDALVLGNNTRVVEETTKSTIKPQFQNIHDWEFYSSNLLTEYTQSIEEGLDIEKYKDVFYSISRLPKCETKKKLGDVLYDVVMSSKTKSDYEYIEPSDIEQIQAVRRGNSTPIPYDKSLLKSKIHGAWIGRICGCMLGKTVEGILTTELHPFLKESGNFPMWRYIYKSDLPEDVITKYTYNFSGRDYADEIDGMPVDDDINYVVLAQKIIDDYGKNFTPFDVSRAWIKYQPKDAYCTAERVAFCNFINGYAPPHSAIYKNPYREWIGAQIRGDYFGYINPGNPKLASEMAYKDASISHVKNGIYGEMLISAMLAVSATTSDIEKIILGGLAEIPQTSRLHESALLVLDYYNSGKSQDDCFKMIREKYDETSAHDWCHTIPNAMIVLASLLYGEGDFGKSICMAVETGFDTDCNGATVGSVLGMANGIERIPDYWKKPINNKLHTSIFGVGTVNILDCVEKTLSHIEK